MSSMQELPDGNMMRHLCKCGHTEECDYEHCTGSVNWNCCLCIAGGKHPFE